jgi:hypothetical protein
VPIIAKPLGEADVAAGYQGRLRTPDGCSSNPNDRRREEGIDEEHRNAEGRVRGDRKS